MVLQDKSHRLHLTNAASSQSSAGLKRAGAPPPHERSPALTTRARATRSPTRACFSVAAAA
eukprot:CAMPEP_0195599284 /NCGR_PEP_ID=MMETSP0815-20121206/3953_1 /TAXON_ID=97485 /ORGANISM="Prymnesium parvum, Strain Texoma1" /LENGTH=60 /DNA_ID=CAMNT_0040738715 /DNA_START=158 /DNA_END=337 /DNA_ORIENTATION=-